jgi:hypothetical protein
MGIEAKQRCQLARFKEEYIRFENIQLAMYEYISFLTK